MKSIKTHRRPLLCAVLAYRCLATLMVTAAETSPNVPWHVQDAEVRFEISVYLRVWKDGPDAEAVHVSICPTGIAMTQVHPVVCDEKGVQCPVRILHRRDGEPWDLVFDPRIDSGVPATGAPNQSVNNYFLYLAKAEDVSGQRLEHPRGGLLLETRTHTGTFEELSVETFQQRWQEAQHTNGARFVDAIHHAAPVIPRSDEVPRQFASHAPSGVLLNRYTAFFAVDPDAEAITNAQVRFVDARQRHELLMTQAEEAKHKLNEAEYELVMAAKYPGVIKVSPDVLRERLYDRLQAYDRLTKTELVALNEQIRKETNTLHEIQSGRHTFLAGARGGSHLLIDGREIIDWPADKSLSRYHGRYVNQAKAEIELEPGLHRLEFLHYAESAHYMATVAWRPPGGESARTFSASDAQPLATGTVTGIATAPPTAREPLLFSWRIVEDLRCPDVDDMVHVDFTVMNPRADHRYTWDFGNGRRGSGRAISHLYFQTGAYPVVLSEEAVNTGEAAREVRHTVRVHVLWTKHELAHLARYETLIANSDLTGARLAGLLNAYAFASCAATDGHALRRWREHLRTAIAARLDELSPEQADVAVRLAGDATHPAVRKYDDARAGYEFAVNHVSEQAASVRIDAMLGLADLALNIDGHAEAALDLLSRMPPENEMPDEARRRQQRLRVHGLIASGEIMQARQAVEKMDRGPQPDAEKQALRLRAELRRARTLVSDPTTGATEMSRVEELLEDIVQRDPRQLLAPEWNLVALRMFLTRSEYRRALSLAQRLLHLDLGDAVRASVLAERIAALHGAGEVEKAHEAMQKFRQAYPFHADPAWAIPPDLSTAD